MSEDHTWLSIGISARSNDVIVVDSLSQSESEVPFIASSPLLHQKASGQFDVLRMQPSCALHSAAGQTLEHGPQYLSHCVLYCTRMMLKCACEAQNCVVAEYIHWRMFE